MKNEEITHEKEEITHKLEIAYQCNSFFCKYRQKTSLKINKSSKLSFHRLLERKKSQQNENSDTKYKQWDKLKPKTSYGFDGISTKLVQQIKLIFVEALTEIINQKLNTGIFPDFLKISKVTLIYKKKKRWQSGVLEL